MAVFDEDRDVDGALELDREAVAVFVVDRVLDVDFDTVAEIDMDLVDEELRDADFVLETDFTAACKALTEACCTSRKSSIALC